MTQREIKEILLLFLEEEETVQLYNIKQLVSLYDYLYDLKLDSKIKRRVDEFLKLLTTEPIEKDGILVNSSIIKYFINKCLEEINKKITITEVQRIKRMIHPFNLEKKETINYIIKIN